MHILNIDPDCYFEIFRYATLDDLFNFAKVCKAWQEYTRDKRIWKYFNFKTLGVPTLLSVAKSGFQLELVDLSGCTFLTDNVFLQCVHSFKNASILNLNGCSLLTDKSLFALVGQLSTKNLRHLDLSDTKFSKVPVAQLLLAAHDQLTCLKLSNVSLSDKLLMVPKTKKFCNFNNVKVLEMRDCAPHKRIFNQWPTMFPNVEKLNLSGCVISEKELANISSDQWKKLKELEISRTQISNLSFLKPSETLITLKMRYCPKLKVDTKLSTLFPNLQNLDIQTIKGTNIIPEDVFLDLFQIPSLLTLRIGFDCKRFLSIPDDMIRHTTIPKTIKCKELQELELDIRYLSTELCIHIAQQLQKLKYIRLTPQWVKNSTTSNIAQMIEKSCQHLKFHPFSIFEYNKFNDDFILKAVQG